MKSFEYMCSFNHYCGAKGSKGQLARGNWQGATVNGLGDRIKETIAKG